MCLGSYDRLCAVTPQFSGMFVCLLDLLGSSFSITEFVAMVLVKDVKDGIDSQREFSAAACVVCRSLNSSERILLQLKTVKLKEG